MSADMIPSSGVSRRRAKAVRNREAVAEMRFFIDGTIPGHAVAVDMCPCGRVSWLGRGASDEDHEAFRGESDDHSEYCYGADS